MNIYIWRQFQKVAISPIALRRDRLASQRETSYLPQPTIGWSTGDIPYHISPSRPSDGLLEIYHFISPPADHRIVYWTNIISYLPQPTIGWSTEPIIFHISPTFPLDCLVENDMILMHCTYIIMSQVQL